MKSTFGFIIPNSADEIMIWSCSVHCNELLVERHQPTAKITPLTQKLHICPQAIECVLHGRLHAVNLRVELFGQMSNSVY